MSVRVDREGPVTTVTIDRPEARNAVDRPTAEALADAFRDFDADDSASRRRAHRGRRALLRRGRPQGGGRRVAATGSRPTATARWDPAGLQLSKPVIAAIEGHAVAGGLELALWADLRVAARDAVLGVFCRRWGVPLIDGGTVRLPRLIGESRAMDLVLTGRAVPGRRGLRDGAGQPALRTGRGTRRRAGPGGRDRGVPADLHAAGPAQRAGAVGAAGGARRWASSSPTAWSHCRRTHWPGPPASPQARAGTATSTAAHRRARLRIERPEKVQDSPPQ